MIGAYCFEQYRRGRFRTMQDLLYLPNWRLMTTSAEPERSNDCFSSPVYKSGENSSSDNNEGDVKVSRDRNRVRNSEVGGKKKHKNAG